jgi:hypothetical protein
MLKGVATTLIVLGLIAICPMARADECFCLDLRLSLLDRFGIPLLMVEIPKENYLVYGGIVGRQFPVWGLAISAAV